MPEGSLTKPRWPETEWNISVRGWWWSR